MTKNPTMDTCSFDEVFNNSFFQIDVVTEKRLYSSWCVGTSPSAPGVGVTKDSGIIGAKLVLNTLHRDLAEKGYNEVRGRVT